MNTEAGKDEAFDHPWSWVFEFLECPLQQFLKLFLVLKTKHAALSAHGNANPHKAVCEHLHVCHIE